MLENKLVLYLDAMGEGAGKRVQGACPGKERAQWDTAAFSGWMRCSCGSSAYIAPKAELGLAYGTSSQAHLSTQSTELQQEE
jgi:hypothetical protein